MTGNAPGAAPPLLRVERLHQRFAVRGWLRAAAATVPALTDVSFALDSGRTLGIVGESGCGKTTLARTILRLRPPSAGEVYLHGAAMSNWSRAQLRAQRRAMQMVFQDAHAALDPRYTVARALREPLDAHGLGAHAERMQRVRELLEVVGLPASALARYPHELSGGQRQRVGIARALVLSPQLIVADEPVASLDVSVRAQVLNLLAGLQRERGIAFLFISHDLAVVQQVSHEVAVMYAGRIVEQAPVETLYRAPLHPYTRALLAAVPTPDPRAPRMRALAGTVPAPQALPPGCAFHPRCPDAMPVCGRVLPAETRISVPGGTQVVRCHLHVAGPEAAAATPASARA